MPRLPNRQERAQILASIRAEAWRVVEREAAEQDAAQAKHDQQRRELGHLRDFEAAVRQALRADRLPPSGRGLEWDKALALMANLALAALHDLDAARGGHTDA